MYILDFVVEIRDYVTYNKSENKHYMGGTVLTTKQVFNMLSNCYEDKFDRLDTKKKLAIVRDVFSYLRSGRSG
jgi:hypothetical protein